MIINKIKSPIINKKETTVKEDRSAKSQKSKLKDTGKKILLTLSCLAAAGYLLIHNTKTDNVKTNNQKPNTPSDNSFNEKGSEPKTPQTITIEDNGSEPEASQAITIDKSDYNSGEVTDTTDYEPDINPGYDGLTKVLLAIGIDGNIYEIYELSDGRLIIPADYHFPEGRSIDELSFDRKNIGYDLRNTTQSIVPNYGDYGSKIGDVDAFDNSIIYKASILKELKKLPSGLDLITELYSQENKELHDFIFSIKDISSEEIDAIFSKKISSKDILLALLEKLAKYKEQHSDNETSLQLVSIMQSSIQEKLEKLQKSSSYHQEYDYEDAEEYGYEEAGEIDYNFC